MTAILLPEGRQRYHDNAGAPLAGGQLYTYAAGTTNPKPAYQDAAGTVPHPNPLTLDAKGEAVIFWDGAYKVDLKAPDGTQVTGYPVDNVKTDPGGVAGRVDQLRADVDALQVADYAGLRAYAGTRKTVYLTGYLATSAPAGIAGFFVRDDSDGASADNGGTIIVAANGVRWKRAFTGPVRTAWFGVAVGAAANTAAIQAAINYVSAIGGGELQFDPGQQFNTAGLAPKSNVLINLRTSTLRLNNASNAPVFFDGGAGNGVNFGVVNGAIDCNQAGNNNLNVLGGVWLTGWKGLRFEALQIFSCPRIGLNLVGVSDVEIKNYTFRDSTLGGVLYPYALNIEANGATRSQRIKIDGVNVTNVQGYGVHLYQCDDVIAKNLNFDTLTYAGKSIGITFTELNRCEMANVKCNAVAGDNIEVNDNNDITLDNFTIIGAGNRALLMGFNTAGNYNRRVRINNFKSTGTLGAFAAAMSACIDCDFSRLDLDKDVAVDTSLVLSGGNTIRDTRINAAASGGLCGYGFFTLERVVFTDYTYRYLGRQKAVLSLAANILAAATLDLPMTPILKSVFPLERTAAGKLRTMSRYLGSLNQGSMQTVSFLINDFGTTAALGVPEVINNTVARNLTIAGDAANKKLTLTNGTVVDLNVSIELDLIISR